MSKDIYNTDLSSNLQRYFVNAHIASSFNDIESYLIEVGCKPHKTSIYRQLDRMVKIGTLKVFEIGKKQMWEVQPTNEHSHLLCNHCDRVVCIHINTHLIHTQLEQKHMHMDVLNITGICNLCTQ
jgi:Fe2+ or Zn2+ uptake regulation protein